MDTSDPIEPHDSSKLEVAAGVAKVALSFIPLAGAPATEVLDLVMGPLLRKRNEQWRESVGSAIRQLQQQHRELTDVVLETNASLVSTAADATMIALRTHQQAKLDALRNAVLNAALPQAPSDNDQGIFLRIIDEITECHLRVLQFFEEPEHFGITRGRVGLNPPFGNAQSRAIEKIACLRGRRDLYGYYVRDLINRGLFEDPLDAYPSDPNLGRSLAPVPSRLAHDFMAFITSPLT